MSLYFRGTNQRAFGTFPLDGESLVGAVRTAVEVGYRAFDTAQWYGNEAALGAILSQLNIDRDQILVTTKVHPKNMHADRFLPSVERSLKDLGLDTIDVLLLHWPPNDNPVEASLTLLQEAHLRGYARHIGVCNYTAKQMRNAVRHLDVPLVTNQVEFHPLLNQDKLMEAAVETGIPLSSYCSLARGRIFEYPLFEQIAQMHEKLPGQVALRWILQKGVATTTMSTKRENIVANFDVMDFVLSSIEMAEIDKLRSANYRISNSMDVPYAPTWD